MSEQQVIQIADGGHDGWEDTGSSSIDLTGTDMPMTAGGRWAILLFPGVNAPKDSVTNALLEVYFYTTSSDSPIFDVYGNDVDDAAAPVASFPNISNRTLTSEKAAVSASNVGVGFYSIDVTTIVQAITGRAGWVEGNDLALIIDSYGGTADGRLSTYERNSAQAAKLTIDYTLPGGEAAQVVFLNPAMRSY